MFKGKKTCKHVLKKLPYLLRYVPDRYKTEQMYSKAVHTYFSTINSVLERFMTQEICDQVADVYFLVFDSIPD